MILVFLFLTLGSTYVFLDTALTITSNFVSVDPAKLHSNWLFILTIIWPAVAVAGYFLVQLGVVVRVLREKKPLGTIRSVSVEGPADSESQLCSASPSSSLSSPRRPTLPCRTRSARARAPRWTDRSSRRCWRRQRWWPCTLPGGASRRAAGRARRTSPGIPE